MARRKKTKTKEVTKKPSIEEMEGFRLSDTVWIEAPGGNIFSGAINGFFIDEKMGPCVSIMTQDRGQRCALLEKCSFEKPKKSRKSLLG